MPAEEELPVTLTEDEKEEITWRIKMLVEEAGFDTWHAGRLASIGNLDWHEAHKLKAAGCPQNLVYELLR